MLEPCQNITFVIVLPVNERIVAFVRLESCGSWTRVGEGETDGDGRIEIAVDPNLIDGVGEYELRMVVPGDLSRFAAFGDRSQPSGLALKPTAFSSSLRCRCEMQRSEVS